MKLAEVLCALACVLAPGLAAPGEQADFDWRADWEVAQGFRVDVDTRGYRFPTALAFVPNPGGGPEAPLYFVTELLGSVKVVTRDRTVHTFARDLTRLDPYEELPNEQGEHGVAGICLDPTRGYVFVTFVYHDATGTLRNDIIRFQSRPQTFSLEPSGQLRFTEIFSSDRSSNSHQIGPCQVEGDLLYVSVGNGFQDSASQDLDSTLGKILRLTVDGQPVPTNPFYQGAPSRMNYVWAYGFRNPFGLKIVRGRVFVAENGYNADRFLEVNEGENYLWNGQDWSIGTNALMVFAPAVSPVQTDYYPENSTIFPEEYRRQFYLALAGAQSRVGPGMAGEKSVVSLDFDFERNRLRSPPRHLVRYRGHGHQAVVGLAFGPDGLYFAPIIPNAAAETPVIRVSYDPDHDYSFAIGRIDDPVLLMAQKQCLGCHLLGGRGGVVGPSLDYSTLVPSLTARLDSEEYIEALSQLDRRETTSARQEVARATGMDRVRAWLKHRIREPSFDSPNAQMPNLGLSERQAAVIADYLLTPPEERGVQTSWSNRLMTVSWKLVRNLRYPYVMLAFVGGFALGLVPAVLLATLRKRDE